MLSILRKYAKTWFAAVVVILLMVSFLIVGVQSDLFAPRATWVISAGDRTVSGADFRRAFDGYRAQLQQQSGQDLSAEDAVKAGLDQRMLNDLSAQEAFMAVLDKAGLKPSDQLVLDFIAKAPIFRDQVTGKFDEDAYRRQLAQQDLTPERAEALLRDQFAARHLEAAMAAGFNAPRVFSAVGAGLFLEQRDISFFVVDPRAVQAPAPPTDAQLTAFMQQNSARLMRPELRTFTLVRFDPKALAPQMPVDAAELQKRFDFKKDSLSRPETRSLVQIPAKDRAGAEAVAARLRAGEAPSAVAKATGVEAITYIDKPKSAVTDRAAADAAFALPAGQVSAPVQGAVGWAVVKVDKVTPGQAVTLDAVRAQLETEVRADAAKEKVYAQTQAYDDAHAEGASVADAGRRAGATPIVVGPVTADGTAGNGQPSGAPPKVLETAFELGQGAESDLIDAGEGEYFALKVDKVTAPALPPLAEIKPALTRFYMLQEMEKRLKARADAVAEQVRKGQSVEQAAGAIGAQVNHLTSLDRLRAGQDQQMVQALGREFLTKVFAGKSGDVFVATVQNGVAVARINSVRAGDMAQLARVTEGQRSQAAQALFQDIGAAARNGSARMVKVRTSLERARIALGIDPEEAAGDATPAEPAK